MSEHARQTPTTFLLIPGAGIDPGAWRWTITELERRGHAGIAPPLPLDDPTAGPSAHADAAARAVDATDGPIVVVGQSMGAYAATVLADRLPVSGLILIAPMVPTAGETAGEWWAAVGHAAAIAPLLARLGPMGSWGPEGQTEVFLHDVPPDVASESAALVGGPGPGMFSEAWPLSAWPQVPTRVLAPREDRLFPLAFQRRVTRERIGIEVEEMPGGHVPMFSRPADLAERLTASAAG